MELNLYDIGENFYQELNLLIAEFLFVLKYFFWNKSYNKNTLICFPEFFFNVGLE